MEYKIIAGGSADCKNGDCPTVYAPEGGGDLIVQGYDMDADTASSFSFPNGESGVRIPRDVILDAAKRISEGA